MTIVMIFILGHGATCNASCKKDGIASEIEVYYSEAAPFISPLPMNYNILTLYPKIRQFTYTESFGNMVYGHYSEMSDSLLCVPDVAYIPRLYYYESEDFKKDSVSTHPEGRYYDIIQDSTFIFAFSGIEKPMMFRREKKDLIWIRWSCDSIILTLDFMKDNDDFHTVNNWDFHLFSEEQKAIINKYVHIMEIKFKRMK